MLKWISNDPALGQIKIMPTLIRLRLMPLDGRVVPTAGYFRVAEYNIASSMSSPASGLNTILQGIGNEHVDGMTQPIDLLALQEVESQATTSQAIVNLMNGLYGVGVYQRGSLDGGTSGSGTQGIVYNHLTLELLSETAVGTVSSSGLARQVLRYKMQPVGYGSSSDFYVYVSHYKANNTTTDEGRRLAEATAIRADADALGQGAQILYVGDFNMYFSAETGYQKLLSAGNGQAVDPINRPGAWHGDASFLSVFTQAPAVNPPNGLTGGGLDDRFDFQLQSGELNDGFGFEYVAGTYHTFGNNGSVGLNGNINASSSTALPDLSNRTTILNLLTTVTDHLPVVADYRVIVPPTVSAVQIGDGTNQRSKVSQIKVVFDQTIHYAGSDAAAYSLQKIVGGNPAGAVSFSILTTTVGTHTEATITFTSDVFDGSIVDGRYRLTVLANQVLVGATAMIADSITNFHRLFGDVNGDAVVNGLDLGFFKNGFGTQLGDAGYLGYLDFDGDGVINGFDFGQFRTRFGTMLP
jgi:endonuclease/exonuclease/phosphatase family metal-dependent hydrolase